MKMQILLAESDENVRESWASALEKEHFEVQKAEGMREALYRYCMKKPDLMICALDLPVEDGLKLITLLNQFNHNCPLVMVAKNSEAYVAVMRPELDVLLKKPLELSQLIGAIKVLLAHWRPEFLTREEEFSSPEPFQMSPRGGGRHYHKKVSLRPKSSEIAAENKSVI